MKKAIFFLTFIILVSNGISAQEQRLANVRKNWISLELGLFGCGAGYEHMFNSFFSAGVNAYANIFLPLLLINNGICANIKFYPGGRIFFLGIGFGYQGYIVVGAGGTGPGITPEIGWKIDVGKEGNFFIQPGIKFPVTFNKKLPYNAAPGIFPYFALGFAF